jgi:RNA polymerase sigma factor (sigma-70 family)
VTDGEHETGPHRVHLSDPLLVRACLAGDDAAWEELVDRYGRLVYSIPRRLGFSEADAEDVFQNVFVTLLRNLGQLRDQTRLSAWLITTTRRETWRLGRRGTRRAEDELDESLPADEPDSLDDVLRWEREQGVRQAMRRLDDRCRELLTALFLEPATPSYEAIASRLGIPVGSIGPTRARCFKKLDAILRELGIDGAV